MKKLSISVSAILEEFVSLKEEKLEIAGVEVFLSIMDQFSVAKNVEILMSQENVITVIVCHLTPFYFFIQQKNGCL